MAWRQYRNGKGVDAKAKATIKSNNYLSSDTSGYNFSDWEAPDMAMRQNSSRIITATSHSVGRNKVPKKAKT